jgi:hypothetical protein
MTLVKDIMVFVYNINGRLMLESDLVRDIEIRHLSNIDSLTLEGKLSPHFFHQHHRRVTLMQRFSE